MPQAAGFPAPYKPCTRGYRLHLGDGRVQLYNKTIAGTFVFISRPARAPGKEQSEVITSIALQMISGHVRNVRNLFLAAKLIYTYGTLSN
jgi:regulator of nonsense transcripts 1